MKIIERIKAVHDRLYVRAYRPPSRTFAGSDLDSRKINYGCGRNPVGGWVNVDILPRTLVPKVDGAQYLKLSLTSRHPFPDEFWDFAYSEDFIEHLSQADAILFLFEAYRTLRQSGTFRLSFPALRGVLRTQYTSARYDDLECANEKVFRQHGHLHFFCEESLEVVARHIGFRTVVFQDYRQSDHPALQAMDTREAQRDVNIYAELTK